jgi:3-oxoacyl-[acyl-carrier protein] reductase
MHQRADSESRLGPAYGRVLARDIGNESDRPISLCPGLAPETRVNAVAPGFVDTGWTRTWPKATKEEAADRAVLKRFCTPQDIADVIVFLCVGTSMITGQTIVVDGGLSL